MSENIIVQDQLFVLCSFQQLTGNVKLFRAYEKEMWQKEFRTIWKQKACDLACNSQADVHLKFGEDRNGVLLLQLATLT